MTPMPGSLNQKLTPDPLITLGPIPPHDAPKMPYILCVALMILVGLLTVIAILFLRPGSDALEVIGKVGTWITPTTGAIIAIMKAQETHLSVNSRLDAWIEAQSKIARMEGHSDGMVQGAAEELVRTNGASADGAAKAIADALERTQLGEKVDLIKTATEENRDILKAIAPELTRK